VSLDAAVRHLRQGDWERAHLLVQDDESPLGCWAHAIVHLREGDTANARYWFERARREFSSDVDGELDALTKAVQAAQ